MMIKSYLSGVSFPALATLLFIVLITGCATIGQNKSLLSAQVIDGESGSPLSDVHVAITYHESQGAQACYAAAVVKTDAQGYFDVPFSAAASGAPAIGIRPYKRGYIFIAYDQDNVIWPVGINRNTIDVSADVVQKKSSPTVIQMHKNNMNPGLRLEYVGELVESNFNCADAGQLDGYLAIVRAEVTDLQALGLTRDPTRVNDWYGPGIEGLQRQSAASALLEKSKSKAPLVKLRSRKKTAYLTPRQIANRRARERRRLERRKKLDEIRMKSQ